jgi:hypothetical protein
MALAVEPAAWLTGNSFSISSLAKLFSYKIPTDIRKNKLEMLPNIRVRVCIALRVRVCIALRVRVCIACVRVYTRAGLATSYTPITTRTHALLRTRSNIRRWRRFVGNIRGIPVGIISAILRWGCRTPADEQSKSDHGTDDDYFRLIFHFFSSVNFWLINIESSMNLVCLPK